MLSTKATSIGLKTFGNSHQPQHYTEVEKKRKKWSTVAGYLSTDFHPNLKVELSAFSIITLIVTEERTRNSGVLISADDF